MTYMIFPFWESDMSTISHTVCTKHCWTQLDTTLIYNLESIDNIKGICNICFSTVAYKNYINTNNNECSHYFVQTLYIFSCWINRWKAWLFTLMSVSNIFTHSHILIVFHPYPFYLSMYFLSVLTQFRHSHSLHLVHLYREAAVCSGAGAPDQWPQLSVSCSSREIPLMCY